MARWARALVTVGLLVSAWAFPVASLGASPTVTTWASLGALTPSIQQLSQWGSALDTRASSQDYAWCGDDGIHVVEADGSVRSVPETGVEAMLAARALNINNTSKVACDLVVTDPVDPKTVYAGFETGQNHSIPPVATVAMYTNDDGVTWQYIPPPATMTYVDFGGFVLRGNVVHAVFTNEVELASLASRWTIDAEVQGSSGAWTSGSLACPTVGPCVAFGPEIPQGACGMSSWLQPLLVAVPGSLPGDPLWEGTSWASGIPECAPALVFTDQRGDEYLLDFAMRYPLARSVDAGHAWRPVELPLWDGHKVGGSPTTGYDLTTVTSSGDLLVIVSPAYQTTERLLLLVPGASKWCTPTGILPSGTRTDPILAVGTTTSRLVMLQDATKGPVNQGGPEHSVPLAALRCTT